LIIPSTPPSGLQYEVDSEKPPVSDIDLEACRFSSGMAEVYVGVNRNHIGHVAQVIGPVLDLQFEAGQLPEIYHAVRITSQGFDTPEPLDVIAEVQQHLGEGRVRAIAMEPSFSKVIDLPGRPTSAA
jgi:hypothetical protein